MTSSINSSSYNSSVSQTQSTETKNSSSLYEMAESAFEAAAKPLTKEQISTYNDLISKLKTACNYDSLSSTDQANFSNLADITSSTAIKLAKDPSPLNELLSLPSDVLSSITKYPASTTSLLSYPALLKNIATDSSLQAKIKNDTSSSETDSVIGKLVFNESCKSSIFTMMQNQMKSLGEEARKQQDEAEEKSREIRMGQ